MNLNVDMENFKNKLEGNETIDVSFDKVVISRKNTQKSITISSCRMFSIWSEEQKVE